MKKTSLVIVLIISLFYVLFTPCESSAAFLTVNDLIDPMREYKKAVMRKESGADIGESKFFQAYVMGVVDATASESLYDMKATTSSQVLAIVIKYIEAHPEEWQINASWIVQAALIEAFPLEKEIPPPPWEKEKP